jgi:DNA-directed RNA polymerase specialized sigma subunit
MHSQGSTFSLLFGAESRSRRISISLQAGEDLEPPEDALLRVEQDERAAELAGEFLVQLRRVVNNNERRYERLLSTLWYCYYDTENHSQLEIARRLGVSDSLVSDSRKLVEHELRKLKLSIEEGAVFSESLQRLLTPSVQVN